MRATLAFDLPEEAAEHRLALDAPKYASALEDYVRWLRDRLKHGSLGRVERKVLEQCREAIVSAVNDNGLNLP